MMNLHVHAGKSKKEAKRPCYTCQHATCLSILLRRYETSRARCCKFVAELPQPLREVELDSSSCNVTCNENAARPVHSRLERGRRGYTGNVSCVATKLRGKMPEKSSIVTNCTLRFYCLCFAFHVCLFLQNF